MLRQKYTIKTLKKYIKSKKMKIFFIKLNFYNIHIKFKMLTKKSLRTFWYFNEASPIQSTHFWKDFAFGKGKDKKIILLVSLKKRLFLQNKNRKYTMIKFSINKLTTKVNINAIGRIHNCYQQT